ncbi:MAG: divalent-cation tolerance protein CutA [Deltaproteobacteria bacterium]|nr:divalent-cation tolerance protein CutA [Deltaproteobacteria bacterium]
MDGFIIVFVTVGSSDEAEQLARVLVEERLAACVNRINGVQSIYRWVGQVEESEEDLLIIKSKSELFERLKQRVRELHSYSVPEIIALPVVDGNEEYLKWWEEQVEAGSK